MINNDVNNKLNVSKEKINECILTLENLVNNYSQLDELDIDQRIALLTLAGKLSRPNRDEIRRRNRELEKSKRQKIVNQEKKIRSNTGIRIARQSKIFKAPDQITDVNQLNNDYSELNSPRNCYICKAEYTKVHFFYDAMCPSCAEFNYQKRFQTADLTGKTALITGSRVKIGYQAALMMLRAGARVIATTRFPIDASLRFSKEKDFHEWASRLHIYGLDLRHTPSVEIFTRFIEQNYDRLDILINNAAQTVRRPPGFYSHLMDNELLPFEELSNDVKKILADYHKCISGINATIVSDEHINNKLPVTWNEKQPGIGLRLSAQLSQIPYSYDNSINADKIFPKGKLDADLQQIDLREVNSWRLKLGEIPTIEMIETHLVNAVAPFVLCNKLIPFMKRDYTGQKHIVNVTAMEGKFFRFKTNGRHPHTNMAKAALNMLTHTTADDLAKYGIFINAVDTGWVTDEDPVKLAKLKEELHDFQPPLDIVDGAARVCDPFFNGILTGNHWCGKFLKDYFPIDW